MRPRDFEIILTIRIVYDPNEFFVETYFVFLNPYSQSRASKTVDCPSFGVTGSASTSGLHVALLSIKLQQRFKNLKQPNYPWNDF